MKKLIYTSLGFFLSFSNIWYASDNSRLAFKKLEKHLSGHLLSSDKKCPKDSEIEFYYLEEIRLETKINSNVTALILRTESCPGWGIDASDHLVIIENGRGFIVKELSMGYFSFTAQKIRTKGDLIILDGSRHTADMCDACSVKAKVIYNFKTKKIIKE